MAYANIYDVATDPASTLRKQVAVAVMVAARDVRNESPETPNHARRLAWADRVAADGPGAWADRLVWRVLEVHAINTAPLAATDAAVQSAVNATINYYAGM